MNTQTTGISEYEQKAIDFLNKYGIKYSAKFKGYKRHFADDKEERDTFLCTLRRNGKSISFNFGQSINDTTGYGTNPPTAYDLLTSVTKYDPYDFHNFCGDYGYEEFASDGYENRKSMRIYKAVEKEWQKVNSFFSAEEIEELQEIQ
jgi:hypothetical protein